ncbi:hypothetical protein MY4824_003100 [Beauveria thailandica]
MAHGFFGLMAALLPTVVVGATICSPVLLVQAWLGEDLLALSDFPSDGGKIFTSLFGMAAIFA